MDDLRRGRLDVSPYYFEVDMKFFHEILEDFLPEEIIDIHSHIAGPEEAIPGASSPTFWAERVCPEGMTLPSLLESYVLMFPGKRIRPVLFAMPSIRFDPEKGNEYVAREAKRFDLSGLILTNPNWSADELEERVEKGGFKGLKPYPSTVDKPADEIGIYDYLPEEHLELADQGKWLVILHIPRNGRLADPDNIQHLIELDDNYPEARVIVAHVGRAYCPRYGEGLSALQDTTNLFFDISANTNQAVFEKLINIFGSNRIVFGSDMPIAAMHARRICEGDNYVNIVLNADWEDNHTRIGSADDRITFFLYEEIAAFKRAAERKGLDRRDIERIFFRNAAKILGLE